MISIRKLGAEGTGLHPETETLQKAIDLSSRTGETVKIEPGTYLTGTLFLRDNVRIEFEDGACLLGSDDFSDYSPDVNLFTDAVGHLRGRSLLYGDHVENVSISGPGIIDGRGAVFSPEHPHHLERPFLVRLMNSRHIHISDVTLTKSAAWTLHLMDCEDITIKHVSIHSRVNGNNDGIDIDACRSCLIEDCRIDTGDDAVCLKSTVDKPCSNVTVRNCMLTTDWAAFKIGTESVGDFSNILFEDSYIYDCKGCAIKICPVDGANVDGLTIRNIRLRNSTGPVFIANGDRLRTYQPGNTRKTGGTIKNVLISGLYGDCTDAAGTIYQGEEWGNAKSAVCISGTPEQRLSNITLSDVTLTMAGGVTEYTPRPVPPMGKRYPEFHNFGVLPAWGLYVRYADQVTVQGLSLSAKSTDIRPDKMIET